MTVSLLSRGLALVFVTATASAQTNTPPATNDAEPMPKFSSSSSEGTFATTNAPDASTNAPAAAAATPAAAPSANARSTEVWIGGGLAWADLIDPANKDQWDFLQKNADGFYINNFAMGGQKIKEPDPGLPDRLKAMHDLLDHKRVFYETDLVHAASDDFDTGCLALFDQAGFAYAGATINYGNSPARTAILTKNGQYPLLYMFGPWKQGGDIMSSENDELRGRISAVSGGAVDGPMTMWIRDAGHMHDTVYSTIKWCHANGKKFLYLLAPNDSGREFLPDAQNLVHGLEDNKAMPDMIAASFYGPHIFREKLETLPEKEDDGKPAHTFCGAPYWIINHLKDPQNFARLSTPETELAASVGQTFQVTLANRSDWLDLAPVVRAEVEGNRAGWDLRWFVGGREVTAEMTGGGLAFLSDLRLNPGRREEISLQVDRVPWAQAGLTVQLELRPNPSQARVEQTLVLHLHAAAPPVMAQR